MIARHWKGSTKPFNTDATEELLRDKVLPDLRKDYLTIEAATFFVVMARKKPNSLS